MEFLAEDGEIAVARRVEEVYRVFAAGDAYRVSGGEFFNVLSVGGKQQVFAGGLYGDFDDAGVGNDQRAVAQCMGADHADAEGATAGL